MCGIFGFSGYRDANPMKIRILATENQSRGRDSVGIYGKKLMRKVGLATDFVKDCNFDHIATAKMVVGHTRNSTTNSVTKYDAHPFEYQIKIDDVDYPLIGTHNGWLVNEHEVEKKIEGFKRANVDSDSMFKAMALTNDIKAFQLFEGPMAIAFIAGNSLYLYRRDSRPIHLGKTKEGIYYSSEKRPLTAIGIQDSNIYELNPNILVRVRDGGIISCEKVEEPRVQFRSHTGMGYWENLTTPEVVEQLTGKKPVKPVQSTAQSNTTHGGTKTTTTTDTDGKDQRATGSTDSRNLQRSISPLTREEKMMETKDQQLFGTELLLPSRNDVESMVRLKAFIAETLNTARYSWSSHDPKMIDLSQDGMGIFSDLWVSKHPFSKASIGMKMFVMENKSYTGNDLNQKKRSDSDGVSIRLRLKSYRDASSELVTVNRDTIRVIAKIQSSVGPLLDMRSVGSTSFMYIPANVIEGAKDFKVNLYMMDIKDPGWIHYTTIVVQRGVTYDLSLVFDYDFYVDAKQKARQREELGNISAPVMSNFLDAHYELKDAIDSAKIPFNDDRLSVNMVRQFKDLKEKSGIVIHDPNIIIDDKKKTASVGRQYRIQ